MHGIALRKQAKNYKSLDDKTAKRISRNQIR